MKNFFRKIGKKIKKLGKKIGGAFKKVFKGIGKFFQKLGPIGTMAMMIIAPYVLGPLMAGMGAASGVGATAGTAAGSAGVGGVAATTAVSSASGISGAVAKTMFHVGKALGTVGKTVTGALEGTLNVLGGGSFTVAGQAAAPGINIGTKLVEGASWVASEASSIMKMPGEQIGKIMPGDGSMLSEARSKLFGDPIFDSTGNLIGNSDVTVPTPDEVASNEIGGPRTPAPERGYNALGKDPEGFAQDYLASTQGGGTYSSLPQLPEGFTGLKGEDLAGVGVPNVSGAATPPSAVQAESLLSSAKTVVPRMWDYATDIPGKFLNSPIKTTAELRGIASTARAAKEWINPSVMPRMYTGSSGAGQALGLQQLATANLDYSNMQPEQFSQEDTVFTNLLPNEQAYDQTLMDILGQDFMFAVQS